MVWSVHCMYILIQQFEIYAKFSANKFSTQTMKPRKSPHIQNYDRAVQV